VKGGVNWDTIAVMLLGLCERYPDPDVSADRIMCDFFVTYGWHFDYNNYSVVAGKNLQELTWAPKMHPESAISVVDPAWVTATDIDACPRNIAEGCTKYKQLAALFQYCHTALSQWALMETSVRCQSPLSTLIGGLNFWNRVIHLYNESVFPYAQAVESKRANLRLK